VRGEQTQKFTGAGVLGGVVLASGMDTRGNWGWAKERLENGKRRNQNGGHVLGTEISPPMFGAWLRGGAGVRDGKDLM